MANHSDQSSIAIAPRCARARLCLIGLAAALAWGGANLARSAAEPSAPKPAAPTLAEQQKAEKLVHELFAEDFAKRTAADQEELAKKLFEAGNEKGGDPAARYVLLRDARDRAAAAGDVTIALAAIDALDGIFAVDAMRLKAAALTTIESTHPAAGDATLAQACLNLSYAALETGTFDVAGRMGALAEKSARLAAVTEIAAPAREVVAISNRLGAAAARLAKVPQDPSANATMGAYDCFARNEWAKGLAELARGSNAALAALAARDLKHPASPTEQFDLAGAWWEAAARQPSIYQNAAEAHAAQWYRLAMPGLTGLPRAIAEKRGAAHQGASPPPAASTSKPPAPAVNTSANGGTGAAAAADPPAGGNTGKTFRAFINSVKLQMVPIPLDPDGFEMGSPAEQWGHFDLEALHHVKLTRRFFIGNTHVTVGQFAAFVKDSGYLTDAETAAQRAGRNGDTPPVPEPTWRKPGIAQGDDHPVTCVTWNDANAFCKWLSAREKRHYRLPTEAEWEYAARARTTTAFFWGNDPDEGKGRVNGADQSLREAFAPHKGAIFQFSDGFVFTSPVSALAPNGFGLYDMAGNVWDWCSDYYAAYPPGEAVDPTGPQAGDAHETRICRGGSWFDPPRSCRSAYRAWSPPAVRGTRMGFRICLDADSETK